MTCGCNEFSRAHLLRSAAAGAAEAGKGLPRIDAGMPAPAGTGLSRRSFLFRSGAAMLSVYGASRLGVRDLQEGIARAAGTTDPVIVTVFMEGGVDGLSVLAPVNDLTYRRLRPTLAMNPLQGSVFTEDTSLRWHPSAAKLDTLHHEGKVSVMPAVSYDDPNQSHFTSRHYWEVGALDPNGQTGWMGRLLDRIGAPDNPLQGLSLDGHLSPALAPGSVPVAAIDGSEYDIWTPGVWGDVEDLLYTSAERIGVAHRNGNDGGRALAGYVQSQAMKVRRDLAPFGAVTPPVPYPNGYFGDNLAALAAMLDAGLPIRCVAMNAPSGYDTHDAQPKQLSDGLQDTVEGVFAFQRDLESRGLADRVITLVWSEFGRRPEQNASNGTDHGAAGVGFVVGTKAKGQMLGEFPGLSRLDEDENLRFTMDFRSVYCSLVEQWFNEDAAAIIPNAASLGRPQVIA
ncbi:MAG: hypothetical protein QOJ38_4 [Solirubrobacterales bacterium]|nr:hypothetical protein [Solirubrobacterales bacterium]